jgi:hypothetical protein
MTIENYRRGVGRLVTDRYDFQDHIDGYSLAHNSSSILLNPNLTINSVLCTNSQTAFTTIANYINTFSFPDATVSVKGILKLDGDLAGLSSSAATPKVSGIQGKPISTLDPSSGDVLTWNILGYWEPAIIPNQFTVGGDLSGTDSDQKVISITGYLGLTSIKCGHFTFDSTVNPLIDQTATTIGAAANLTITGQTSTVSTGGNINISAGFGAPTGALTLRLNNQATTLLEIAQPNTSKSVLSLVKGTPITNTEMPVGTGDKVIYISNASTAPVNPPVGGAILYANVGKLWVKESTGNNFYINDNNVIVGCESISHADGYDGGPWSAFFSTTGSTYVEGLAVSQFIGIRINDIVNVSYSGVVGNNNEGGLGGLLDAYSGYLKLILVDSITDDEYEINGTTTYISNGINSHQTQVCITGSYISVANIPGVLKLMVKNTGTTLRLYGGATLKIEVIRPTP